ncbi:MAG: hypothetical protein LBG19_05645 [Prevotellaceae bacterium]|jgi:opacity protein-like surface antigen|nr:hypothetical protein [Prevotellaceae bacterium]
MKRIWVVIFLIFFPTILFSQWSFVGSVSGGISEIENDFTKPYRNNKGKMGADLSVAVRYSIWKFYVSSGVGYQAFKSESGYVFNSNINGYKNLHPEFSYSNIYIPVTIGFIYDRWRVYPIAETGVHVGFPVSLEDRLEISPTVTTKHGEARLTVIGFMLQAGAGFALSERFAIEAKFRYFSSENTSNFQGYKSTWQYIGGQVSFIVKFDSY